MDKANMVAHQYFECEFDALGPAIPDDAFLVVRQGELQKWDGSHPLAVWVVMPGTLEHQGLLALQKEDT